MTTGWRRKRLLVSTFERLLDVTLGDGAVRRIDVVDEGRGIYYGLAASRRRVFVAERNLDIHRRPRRPDEATNTIREYRRRLLGGLDRREVSHGAPSFEDLHQILFDRDALFLTTAAPPFHLRYDLRSRSARALDLESAVPSALRRSRADSPDLYHFNSVAVRGDRLHVLAHNWDAPSFILTIDRAAAHRGEVRLTGVATDLGNCCHDVLPVDDDVWTLDGTGAALVRIGRDGSRERFAIPSAESAPFPRGAARIGDRLVVAYGFWSEVREDRAQSSSMITEFDLRARRFGPAHPLGSHGNTCAVLPL